MRIIRISPEKFDSRFLDRYDRRHDVVWVWRKGACGEESYGPYTLTKQPYTEDWTIDEKRSLAARIMGDGYISYAALRCGEAAGFIAMIKKLRGGYMILDQMHVSAQWRGEGIGRALFEKARETARANGAAALYISACSSQETIAFYRAMGCVLAEKPIEELAAAEPFDLQMECAL